MKKHSSLLLASSLFLALSPLVYAQTATIPGNVFVNGDFEAAPDAPQGWVGLQRPGLSIGKENGNHFLSISNPDPSKNPGAEQTFDLNKDAEGRKWVLTGRIRVKSTTPGTADWQSVRVQNTWLDLNNKVVTPNPMSPAFLEPTDGWVLFRAVLTVPPGAAKIRIQPTILKRVGEADFDDFVLVPEGGAKAAPAGPIAGG